MRPRLCLITPPELLSGGVSLERFVGSFDLALSAGDVASVLLSTRAARAEDVERAIQALRPIAQDAGAAFLLENHGGLARRLSCDGVQTLPDPGAIKQVRVQLGDDMIIGADCGTSRHSAMVAGEAGCDYVALHSSEPGTISWWAEMMEIPCIAYGGITLEKAPMVAALGADFLAIGEAVWNHPGGPDEAVEALNELFSNLSH